MCLVSYLSRSITIGAGSRGELESWNIPPLLINGPRWSKKGELSPGKVCCSLAKGMFTPATVLASLLGSLLSNSTVSSRISSTETTIGAHSKTALKDNKYSDAKYSTVVVNTTQYSTSHVRQCPEHFLNIFFFVSYKQGREVRSEAYTVVYFETILQYYSISSAVLQYCNRIVISICR